MHLTCLQQVGYADKCMYHRMHSTRRLWLEYLYFIPNISNDLGMLLQTYVNNKTVTDQVSDSRVKNTTKNIDGSCTMLHHKHVD